MSTILVPPNRVVPVFPSGDQNGQLIYNAGSSVLYVDSNYTTSASSFPINPGGSLPWDANLPLFMFSPAGTTATVTVGSSNVFDPASIAEQILSQGLAQQISQALGISNGQVNASQTQELLGTVTILAGQTTSTQTFTLPPAAQSIMLLNGASVPIFFTVVAPSANIRYYDNTISDYDYAITAVSPVADPQIQVQLNSAPAPAGGFTVQIVARIDPAVTSIIGSPPQYINTRPQQVVASAPATGELGPATYVSSTAGGVVIAAPGAGHNQSIRIWAISASASISGTSGFVRIYVNGGLSGGPTTNDPILCEARAVSQVAVSQVFPGLALPGQYFGVSVGVQTAGTITGVSCTVWYDIISG